MISDGTVFEGRTFERSITVVEDDFAVQPLDAPPEHFLLA